MFVFLIHTNSQREFSKHFMEIQINDPGGIVKNYQSEIPITLAPA